MSTLDETQQSLVRRLAHHETLEEMATQVEHKHCLWPNWVHALKRKLCIECWVLPKCLYRKWQKSKTYEINSEKVLKSWAHISCENSRLMARREWAKMISLCEISCSQHKPVKHLRLEQHSSRAKSNTGGTTSDQDGSCAHYGGLLVLGTKW